MFGLWWQALPRERASGLGTLAGSRNSSHQLRGGERGEQELCLTGRREGKLSRGHPEERRACALKIIIDPRGEESLVWSWFCFHSLQST